MIVCRIGSPLRVRRLVGVAEDDLDDGFLMFRLLSGAALPARALAAAFALGHGWGLRFVYGLAPRRAATTRQLVSQT